MQDNTDLDLGDLEARSQDLDDTAAEDISGGWFNRGRGGNRSFLRGFKSSRQKKGPVSSFKPIKNRPKTMRGSGSSSRSSKSFVFRKSSGTKRPSFSGFRRK